VITVTKQTAVHETGYTIHILFCIITYARNWTPNFENVVAPLPFPNPFLPREAVSPCMHSSCLSRPSLLLKPQGSIASPRQLNWTSSERAQNRELPVSSLQMYCGRVQLASDFEKRLRAAISCHLTQTSKESA